MNIAATLTRDRHAQPLVVLDSQPFNGLEIRPGDLRQLAQQLNALADMAGKLPTNNKHFRVTKVVMEAQVAQPQPASPPVVAAQSAANVHPACAGSVSRDVAPPSALMQADQAVHTSGEPPSPTEAQMQSVALEIDLVRWNKPVGETMFALKPQENKKDK